MFTYENFATFAVELEKRTLGYSEKRRIGDLSTWRNGDKWTRRHVDTERRTNGYSEKWTLGESETWRHGYSEKRRKVDTEKRTLGESET